MKSINGILDEGGQIAGLVPRYKKGLGNVTELFLGEGGTILLVQSINSSLRAIGNYYALHLRLLRRQQQKLLNCKYYTPLPFHKKLLLFPVKSRIPKIKNDSSVAYINYYHVKKMDYPQGKIHLKSGHIIHSLNTPATLRKRYHHASLSANNFLEDQEEEKEAQYLYPLSRRDLEPVIKELGQIKELLTTYLTEKNN